MSSRGGDEKTPSQLQLERDEEEKLMKEEQV